MEQRRSKAEAYFNRVSVTVFFSGEASPVFNLTWEITKDSGIFTASSTVYAEEVFYLFNFSIVAVSYKAELLSVIVVSPNYQSSQLSSNYQLSQFSTPSHLLICRK